MNGFARKRIEMLVRSVMPDVIVEKVIDWDRDRYVVAAPRKGRTDEIDPYYSVNKQSGEVRPFYVGEDILRFAQLMYEG